jgi:hypothetical protein
MNVLWGILFVVVILYIFKQLKEGYATDSLATKPLATYPRDSIDVLSDATFKPECCMTSPYSSSSGCLCPSKKDAGLIISRGGNR